MNTLIELYDERAIENVLAPEAFRPRHVIYLAPEEITGQPRRLQILRDFFLSRGLDIQVSMETCSLFKADRVYQQLLGLRQRYPDCAVDVTGGSDAALFGAGMFCHETGAAAFTYSRKNNRFYNISGADFADDVPCTIRYGVRDFFGMTGGSLCEGRVDNTALAGYLPLFDPLFGIFLRHRQGWSAQIGWFQRISQPVDSSVSLDVQGALEQKGEHGSRVTGDLTLLQ